MIELILRRTLAGIVIVFLAITSIFLVANGVGDPAVASLGPNASQTALEDFRRRKGLPSGDASLGEKTAVLGQQYMRYLGLAPYPDDIDMPAGYHGLFGLLIGTLAALRRGTFLDTGFMGMAFLGISIPSFVSGPILLMVLAFRMGWFPIGGYGVSFGDHLYHALLPAGTMAIIGAATYARVMRSEMIETMQADFIRTARAKGLSEFRVVLGHGVRNAMLPIVTLMGLSIPLLVNGAIITESIFNWPGMGSLAIESIHALDVPTIMGVVLLAAIAVQIGNLIADIAVGVLDPRVRS